MRLIKWDPEKQKRRDCVFDPGKPDPPGRDPVPGQTEERELLFPDIPENKGHSLKNAGGGKNGRVVI